MAGCVLCPRLCGVDRSAGKIGVCGQSDTLRIARAALHPFEEPPISGTRGSGTIFFVGCSLRCAFCQNLTISRAEQVGQAITERELGEQMLSLQDKGAHNINLVTPTHFSDAIAAVLERIKPKLTVPVVWNSSGYERVETLRRLEGLVDIYLPDFKYASSDLAEQYSAAPDYPQVARAALLEMYRQVGRYEMDDRGLLRKGLVVRHLVLPGSRTDSLAVLQALAELFDPADILLSLMNQYTPEFAMDCPYPVLHRRLTTFEYRSVAERALALGFVGFFQERASQTVAYTPNFE